MAHSEYGQRWAVGDVIGTLINLNTREILFWRNHDFLGVAFSDVQVGPNHAYFPAASLQKNQRAVFNFGQRPFTQRLNVSCLAINEPTCLINGFYNPGVSIMNFFKDFTIGYCHEQNQGISVDERLSIGYLLVEHLMPLMEDPYYLEAQCLQFFCELVSLRKAALIDIVFKVFGLCFSDEYLKRWVSHFMHSCCTKLL